MRYLFFIFFIALFGNICFSETYIVYDKATEEIISISPEQDCTIMEGWEEKTSRENYWDIVSQLEHPWEYYKYKDNRFVVNLKKLSDEAILAENQKERSKEEKMIQKRMRKIAREQLEAEGYEFEYLETEEEKKSTEAK